MSTDFFHFTKMLQTAGDWSFSGNGCWQFVQQTFVGKECVEEKKRKKSCTQKITLCNAQTSHFPLLQLLQKVEPSSSVIF